MSSLIFKIYLILSICIKMKLVNCLVQLFYKLSNFQSLSFTERSMLKFPIGIVNF